MIKLKIAVNCLQVGDVVGSDELVAWVGRGARTPAGKFEVHLMKAGSNTSRLAIWNAHTKVSIQRHTSEQ